MKRSFQLLIVSCFALFSADIATAQQEWPRTITATDGTVINVYQPQTESFAGNVLKSRSAISILEKNSQEPVFGVFWSTAIVGTDRDTREVNMRSLRIDNLKIPADTLHAENSFIRTTLETYVPRVAPRIALDEVLASLDRDEEEKKLATGISNKLPELIFRTQPSMLVLIDGEPKLKMNDKWGLDVVINSPFTIIQDKDGRYYLHGGRHWYMAPVATGPYTFTKDKVRHKLRKIARQLDRLARENDDSPNSETPDDQVYNIIVSTTPAELIQTDGNADLSPIEGTSLLYVTNSDNDIFVDTHSQQYFILLAGRWYSSPALNENSRWQYVAPGSLPADFAKIPEGSPKDDVLASVPGTDAAREAVMDAQIPQTAKVDRRKATTQVVYDGAPEFKPIEGTHLQYGVNTRSTVLLYNGSYYAVDNGVWFVAATPAGPWTVSTSRPEEMDLIPPGCPVYNAKYVYVYDASPDYAYMGYTPGYLNSFVDGPTVVYGTGYDYDPWVGADYYPRPWTWGFDMNYNPWCGWGFGDGYDYDWFNGFGFGLGFGGWYGGGWWGGGWWGGASAYRPAYRHWHGGRFRSDHRGGVYGRTATINGDTHMHMRYNNNVYRGRQGVLERRPEAGGRGLSRNTGLRSMERYRPIGGNNVYSDREGNIYQRGAQGQWQQRMNRGWTPVNSTRPGVTRILDRQQQFGSRGQMRVQNFQRASNFGGMRFGGGHFGGAGGGHFGGGGGGHFGGGGRIGGHR